MEKDQEVDKKKNKIIEENIIMQKSKKLQIGWTKSYSLLKGRVKGTVVYNNE